MNPTVYALIRIGDLKMSSCCAPSSPATQTCVDCSPIRVVKDPNDIYSPIDCAKGEPPIRLLKDSKTGAVTLYCFVTDRDFDGTNKCGWTAIPVYQCTAPAPTPTPTPVIPVCPPAAGGDGELV